jgi:uncharacterized protein YkuJ
MFVKLKNNHSIQPYLFVTGGLNTHYSVGKSGKTVGIGYFGVDVFDPNIFFNYIPEKYIKDFIFQHMKINYRIPPHVDSGIKTTLNFYLKTDSCETVFYTIKENAKSFKLENQTNGDSYTYDDLNRVSSFVARDNEVWLLDVTTPHSVETVQTDIYRHAIVAQTDVYTFDQVKEILRETGNI